MELRGGVTATKDRVEQKDTYMVERRSLTRDETRERRAAAMVRSQDKESRQTRIGKTESPRDLCPRAQES